MDTIKAVCGKGTGMYNFLCHSKKQNMVTKGGGGTFSYFGCDGSASQRCFYCGKEGCEAENCDKPLDKALIKKNYEKYYAANNKAQSQNVGENGYTTKNKRQDRKKKDSCWHSVG